MSKYLLTADWHLGAEEYRWRALEALHDSASRANCSGIIVLGDVMDRKDRIPAGQVQRMLRGFSELAKGFRTYVISGNHDYSKFGESYLELLRYVDNIHVHVGGVGLRQMAGGWPAAFIPHGCTWADVIDPGSLIFTHELVLGSSDAAGAPIPGGYDLREFLKGRSCMVFAGDVHNPQAIKFGTSTWQYVGAPSVTNFGDRYSPQFMLLDLDPDDDDDDGWQVFKFKSRRLRYQPIPIPPELYDRKLTVSVPLAALMDPKVKDRKQLVRRSEGWPYGRWTLGGGDMIRVRLAADISDVDQLPQAAAKLRGLLGDNLDSVEEVVNAAGAEAGSPAALSDMGERELFDAFCKSEGVKGRLRKYGEAEL